MKPKPPQRDEEREERITMEIIVDCYDSYEVRTGWHCYLEDRLAFHFPAECIRPRSVSPLQPGERVTVLGMLDDQEAADQGEMMVRIQWQDRALAVPLAQLKGLAVDAETAEAIADWHYWVAQGREF